MQTRSQTKALRDAMLLLETNNQDDIMTDTESDSNSSQDENTSLDASNSTLSTLDQHCDDDVVETGTQCQFRSLEDEEYLAMSCGRGSCMALVTKAEDEPLFKDFSRLPPEIRSMIWALCFPEPRKLVTTSEGIDIVYVSPKILLLPSPITCFINRESRAETLKLWRVVGKNSFRPNFDEFQLDFESWDNPKYVKSMARFEKNCPGCFSKMEEITLVAKKWCYGFDSYYEMGYKRSGIPNVFEQLPMLKRIIILCPEWENSSVPNKIVMDSTKWFQAMWRDIWGGETVPDLLYPTSKLTDLPETRVNLFQKRSGSFRACNEEDED
ncbi:hypothetical protein EYC80_006366 [Monilinia laxa]|uniref:2EXR domain-containing protein n=1 Tax=Monilinia laxa TaxID=61186 RepID=A0A5N6JTL1_MONLA|nr:hypothetical protein EYC80_006366 [Monilinia laxa]